MHLKITGICSENVLTMINQISKWELIPDLQIAVFCDYSEFDIPINYQFSKVKIAIQTVNLKGQITIRKITQQFGIELEFIPRGWKTICLLEISNQSDLIFLQTLIKADDWGDSTDFVILLNE